MTEEVMEEGLLVEVNEDGEERWACCFKMQQAIQRATPTTTEEVVRFESRGIGGLGPKTRLIGLSESGEEWSELISSCPWCHEGAERAFTLRTRGEMERAYLARIKD